MFYWSEELSACDKCYEECFRCDGPEEVDCLECVMPKYMGFNSCIESYSVKIMKGVNLKAPSDDEIFRPYLMVQLFGEDSNISRDVLFFTFDIPYALLIIYSTLLLTAFSSQDSQPLSSTGLLLTTGSLSRTSLTSPDSLESASSCTTTESIQTAI